MMDDVFYRLGLRLLGKLPAGSQGRVVVVTSARDGEGKTHVAEALARALSAQCSDPVALVACQGAAADGGPGWSELVHEGQWRDDLARERTREDQPVRIPAGQRARVETLFKPEAVDRALSILRQRHGMVIIDAPSLPGCGALLRQADGCVLVVNARDTRREIVQGALAANPVPADRLLGVVLNQRPEYVPGWLYRSVL